MPTAASPYPMHRRAGGGSHTHLSLPKPNCLSTAFTGRWASLILVQQRTPTGKGAPVHSRQLSALSYFTGKRDCLGQEFKEGFLPQEGVAPDEP